ncbi:transcriptional initiation protein Tat [Rhodosalinus halophilus]|uniref:Transcriptional initiation protein Tat n=1 Tax=Rhodosalinus halophilus TaxID=2259333 RepID=A0A365U9K1_9RHOB|nr:PhoX family phosphatase [Rhodosalinus halophilus]RBI85634.1 transcriptional initiation protein Tat [Rhodosalinus halophilus]
MKDVDPKHLSADEWDELNFPRPEENDFDRVVERAISRRGFLGGVLAFGSGAAAMSTGLMGSTSAEAQTVAMSRFPFTPIDAQTDFTVHVPQGYTWDVLVRWGDPILNGVEDFDHATGGSVEASDKVFGENTDGMESFLYQGRQLLAINHEYTNRSVNLPHTEDGTPAGAEDVRKLQNLQGISVIEVREDENGWRVVKDSPFNRRITHNTPMRIVGPAAGHDLLKTDADPTGTMSLGTMNNCGSGKTPWGTYLTCEENFNGYFGSTEEAQDQKPIQAADGYQRYGIGPDGWGYDYHKWDARFDTAKNPNEPHRVGWVVEIDPTDPESTPVKHTGLGRFKHENAEVVLARDGRVVVYMGDDERGEFLYKFVSNGVYRPGESTEGLLDDGTLYVAKFNDDQTGEWLALTPETTGMELPEILIFARKAGSAVGATTMDRPEWIATNPHAIEGYCCLTNNRNRGVKPNAGGDETPVNGPNPREVNHYGQIVRWFPHDDDHAATTFDWDLFVMAGNPTVHDDAYAGSPNITPGNMFNSPDGMAFDQNGLVWIQTDGDDDNEGDFAGMGNNQMLVGDPVTGEIARFMTGPQGCEVTGLCWSADRRTMFVGIQHPGGSWPDGEGLPRSAVIAIKREDNGIIG